MLTYWTCTDVSPQMGTLQSSSVVKSPAALIIRDKIKALMAAMSPPARISPMVTSNSDSSYLDEPNIQECKSYLWYFFKGFSEQHRKYLLQQSLQHRFTTLTPGLSCKEVLPDDKV
jgi:hypothetical protein